MSEAYEIFKNKFRDKKRVLDTEVKTRFKYGVRPTDIMCVTWYVKQTIDRMRSEVDVHILCENTLSTREVKVLYKYIDILNDSYWDRLYNIAGERR